MLLPSSLEEHEEIKSPISCFSKPWSYLPQQYSRSMFCLANAAVKLRRQWGIAANLSLCFSNSFVFLVLSRCLFSGLLLPALLPCGDGPPPAIWEPLAAAVVCYFVPCQLPPFTSFPLSWGFPTLSALLRVSVQLSKPWACLSPQW